MYQVKISSKGQITIPKKLREKLNLNKGDQLVEELRGNADLLLSRDRGFYRNYFKELEIKSS